MSLLLLFGGGGGSTPPPPPPPEPTVTTSPIGVGGKAWANRTRLPKKKRKLADELDEMLLVLRERIEEEPNDVAEPQLSQWELELRKAEALAYQSEWSAAATEDVRKQLAFVKEAIQEMDDEEALLLTLH